MARVTKTETKKEDNELSKTIAAARKKYGQGVIVSGGNIKQPTRIPTGIFTIDLATLGGIPRNRCSMFMGAKHSGKSSLASIVAGNEQKINPDATVVWEDIENSAETGWMAKLGTNINDILIIQPETGEIASDMGVAMVESKEVSLLVIDSVAALVPFKEYDSAAEDAFVGLQARLVGSFIRKITASLIKERLRGHEVTIVFLNQYRCIAKDTLVWTNRGLIPIYDVGVGDYIESPTGFSRINEVVDSGEVDGVELYIKKHYPIRMSNNHRHIIIGNNGLPYEILASNIRIGDWVILSESTDILQNDNLEDRRIAPFLGMYFADGCVTKSESTTDYRVAIGETNEDRKYIVENYMRNLFVGIGSYAGTNNSIGLPGVSIINRYEAGYKGSDKVVPKAILEGGKNTIIEFLRYATFDTHGFVRNKFYWTFESESQAGQIASLLKSFGIKADRTLGPTHKYNYLTISAEDAVLFRDIIGFIEPSKKLAALSFYNTKDGARGKYDVVPRAIFNAIFIVAQQMRMKGISEFPDYAALYAVYANDKLNASRARLLAFASKAAEKNPYFDYWVNFLTVNRFSQIIDIHPCRFDAIDIEVDGGLFYANGILTHNSLIGGYARFGEAISIPGGKALGHCTSLELDLKNYEIAGKSEEGTGVISHNEHTFVVKKNKMNNGERGGKYVLVREQNLELGLTEGDIDDAETVLSYAKNLGMYSGSGSAQKKLDVDGKTISAARDMDIVKILNDDDVIYWSLRTSIIRKIAENRDMDSDFIESIDKQKYVNLRRRNR